MQIGMATSNNYRIISQTLFHFPGYWKSFVLLCDETTEVLVGNIKRSETVAQIE